MCRTRYSGSGNSSGDTQTEERLCLWINAGVDSPRCFLSLLTDQVNSGEGASMSASHRSDPARPPGSDGRRRHRTLFDAAQEQRLQPGADPRPLPDSEPPCCAAPPGPGACQDLSPSCPFCSLLSCWTPKAPLHLKDFEPRGPPGPGQGLFSASFYASGVQNILVPCRDR